MRKIIFILGLLISQSLLAQEFQAKITVNATRVNSTVDRKIFTTLQNQLINFFNNRKWTNDTYKNNEKITVNFVLNIESLSELNMYKGMLIIQAARPVHSTSFSSAIMNYQDAEVQFKYIEYQPVEFNENRVGGSDANAANLTAVFAFYANMILGLTYDSYAPKAGEPYFTKALNIVNNAPEASGINGWKAFDGFRNRYWLVENLTNNRNNVLHSFLYDYYRNGMDKMISKEKEAVQNVVKAFSDLKIFNVDFPNTMFVQFFMQNRNQELISVFRRGQADDKTKALEFLQNLDPTNFEAYKDGLK